MGVRRRSVLILTQSTAMGGQETQALYLAESLHNVGWSVSFCVPRDPQFDVLSEAAARFAKIARLDTDARHGRAHQAAELLRLWRFTRDTKAAVMHVHTGGATGGLAPAVVARLAGIRPVRTEHDVPCDNPSRKMRLSTMASDRLFHSVVAVSRRNARLRIARLGRHSNMAVVLNGVPEPNELLAPDELRRVREVWGFGPGQVVFGSLVRLADGKGLDTLLEAFAAVASHVPHARLFLVGDGPLRAALRQRADELGIGEAVVFAGFHSKPAPLIQAMDVFVLAVPAGSMSIALLEAMAVGVPPIITFGGPEEAVIDGECGLTAEPNAAADLARQMLRLAEDPELRQRFAAAAAERVRLDFSAKRVAADYLSVYGGQKPPERLSNVALAGATPKAEL